MKLNKKQSGQGMTEYILIVALIAVAVIAAVKIFGSNVSAGFNNAAGQISNNTGSATSNPAGAAGNAVGNAANNAANNAIGSATGGKI
jgi:type IV pilus assembly protein PilA